MLLPIQNVKHMNYCKRKFSRFSKNEVLGNFTRCQFHFSFSLKKTRDMRDEEVIDVWLVVLMGPSTFITCLYFSHRLAQISCLNWSTRLVSYEKKRRENNFSIIGFPVFLMYFFYSVAILNGKNKNQKYIWLYRLSKA